MKRTAFAAAILLACTLIPVGAQSPASMADARHDARHTVMSYIGSQMRTLSNMARSPDAYDAEYARTATKAIAALAKAFPHLFPDDDGAGDLSQSEAAVLAGYEDFLAEIAAFQRLANTLASTSDASGFAEAFGPFSGACRSCHSRYRFH